MTVTDEGGPALQWIIVSGIDRAVIAVVHEERSCIGPRASIVRAVFQYAAVKHCGKEEVLKTICLAKMQVCTRRN
jgi:hypothetical protein